MGNQNSSTPTSKDPGSTLPQNKSTHRSNSTSEKPGSEHDVGKLSHPDTETTPLDSNETESQIGIVPITERDGNCPQEELEAQEVNQEDVPDDFAELVDILFSEGDVNGEKRSNDKEEEEEQIASETDPGQNETLTPESHDVHEKVINHGSKKEKNSVRIFSAREVRNGKVIGEGGFGRVLKGMSQ